VKGGAFDFKMTTGKQTKRDAKRLFRLCLVNGRVDDGRARQVVQERLGHSSITMLSITSSMRMRCDSARPSSACLHKAIFRRFHREAMPFISIADGVKK
jgi:hypothetical protein